LSYSGLEMVRPALQPNRKPVKRYHLRMDREEWTLCGLSCLEWSLIGDADLGKVLSDDQLCKHCHNQVLK